MWLEMLRKKNRVLNMEGNAHFGRVKFKCLIAGGKRNRAELECGKREKREILVSLYLLFHSQLVRFYSEKGMKLN